MQDSRARLGSLGDPNGPTPPFRFSLPSDFAGVTSGPERRELLIDTTFTGASETPALEFSAGGKGATGLDDLTRLVTTLKDDISKLQDEVKSLRTKLEDYFINLLIQRDHGCPLASFWERA